MSPGQGSHQGGKVGAAAARSLGEHTGKGLWGPTWKSVPAPLRHWTAMASCRAVEGRGKGVRGQAAVAAQLSQAGTWVLYVLGPVGSAGSWGKKNYHSVFSAHFEVTKHWQEYVCIGNKCVCPHTHKLASVHTQADVHKLSSAVKHFETLR